jgi:hypothetical protein
MHLRVSDLDDIPEECDTCALLTRGLGVLRVDGNLLEKMDLSASCLHVQPTQKEMCCSFHSTVV